MRKPVLAANGLDVSLGDRTDRGGSRHIVRAATLQLHPGELVGLVGPNGAGKSTLLRALAGLQAVTAGHVLVDDTDLTRLPPRERGRRLAYLAQERTIGWDLEVRQIVALGRHPHADRLSAPDEHAVNDAMRAAGVAALSQRRVHSLSGGERARVLLARALAVQAPVLLADEPTESLDARYQIAVMQLLATVAHAGAAVLCVLHDLTHAARWCDRVIVMADGQIVADGPPAQSLSLARIEAVFGVVAIEGEAGGQRYLVPWETVDAPNKHGSSD